MSTQHSHWFDFLVRISAGEVPPDDGAIGSTSVKSRGSVQYGGGGDSVKRRRARPDAGYGSALHHRPNPDKFIFTTGRFLRSFGAVTDFLVLILFSIQPVTTRSTPVLFAALHERRIL